MAKAVKARDYPMVLNFVLHRHNIDQLDKIIELCIELEADDVELATCQFYGWAFLNREGLLPTGNRSPAPSRWSLTTGRKWPPAATSPTCCSSPRTITKSGRKAAWAAGDRFSSASPRKAPPCLATARQLPVAFPSVLEQSLESIWYDSFGFNRYRGYDWMPEPCRSCDEKRRTSAAAAARPLC